MRALRTTCDARGVDDDAAMKLWLAMCSTMLGESAESGNSLGNTCRM